MFEMIKLNYNLDAFNNIISEETFKYHYEVLYKGYVDNFNKTLRELQEARNNNDYKNIKAIQKDLAFQGAGAVLHTLFFENITPNQTSPSNDLLNRIENDFGSFDKFHNQFINSLTNIEGPGWGALGYCKSLDRLLILQIEKHQDLSIWDFKPLLILDMWEHAYYLDYQTDKKKYANNIFEIIDWNTVNIRYNKAKIG